MGWKDKLRVLWQRFKEGIAEILLSLAGSIGAVWLISALLALDDRSLTTNQAFHSYFEGGQVGLTILAVSGATFGALLRHPGRDRLWSVVIILILFVPIVGTSFIIGRNPGFTPGNLSAGTLELLWWFYVSIHILWLIFIIRKPNIPNAQQAGEQEKERVGGVKGRAIGRV